MLDEFSASESQSQTQTVARWTSHIITADWFIYAVNDSLLRVIDNSLSEMKRNKYREAQHAFFYLPQRRKWTRLRQKGRVTKRMLHTVCSKLVILVSICFLLFSCLFPTMHCIFAWVAYRQTLWYGLDEYCPLWPNYLLYLIMLNSSLHVSKPDRWSLNVHSIMDVAEDFAF